MNRKQRRALDKKVGEKTSEHFSDKISQFQNLPDECLACLTKFDKTDREMVTTWSVVVRSDDVVRLYCPNCWDKATAVVEQYKNTQNKETT